MFPLVGLGVGLIGAIGKLFGAGKAKKQLNQLQSQDPAYTANPLAQQRLGLAETMLNSKMPGSAIVDRGINTGYANQQGNIERNATSGAQALALGASNVGQANDAFEKEGQDAADWYKYTNNNLNTAQQGVINEGDKVFADQTRRFGDKVDIQGQINKNRQNVWQSISDTGFGLADLGVNSGMGGGFNPFAKKPLNPYTTTVGNIPQNQINP